MDISEFMGWFINQVITIFTKCFNIMNNLQFGGTSLLKVMVTIVILVPLLSVVLTISQSVSVIGQKSERIREKRERAEYRKNRRNKKG